MTQHWHRCDLDPCNQPDDLAGFILVLTQLDRIENLTMSLSVWLVCPVEGCIAMEEVGTGQPAQSWDQRSAK